MPSVCAEQRRVAISVDQLNRSIKSTLRAHPSNRLQLQHSRCIFHSSNDLCAGDVTAYYRRTARYGVPPLIRKVRTDAIDASVQLPLRCMQLTVGRQLRPFDGRIANVD